MREKGRESTKRVKVQCASALTASLRKKQQINKEIERAGFFHSFLILVAPLVAVLS